MYVGVTNDLARRLYEHKNKLVKGFSEKYNVNKLVYFEETGDVLSALEREKEIKKWRREKKNTLVERMNPEWKDLSDEEKDFSLRNDTSARLDACFHLPFSLNAELILGLSKRSSLPQLPTNVISTAGRNLSAPYYAGRNFGRVYSSLSSYTTSTGMPIFT
jgi:putative endonuclease